jgi:uncharacterized circularly permuted ATP-grasp superfamily protein
VNGSKDPGADVRQAIDAYHEGLVADRAAAAAQHEALTAAFQRAGILYDGAPMRTLLRPHLIARTEWETLRAASRRLIVLLSRVARRAFDGDVARLLDWLGTPDAERRWVALDPGTPDVVWSRLDAFCDGAAPRFIEVNSDAPAGFGYGDAMARAFESLPAFAALRRRILLRHPESAPALVEAVVGAFHAAGGRGVPRVAIVDFAEVKTRPDQELLREAFAARGIPCALADPRDCELRAGRLYAGAAPADVVYRRAVLSELVEPGREVADLFAAYEARAAVFVNSFRCRLAEDKALLALVTDEAHAGLLSQAERLFVASVVPWTRRLEERRTRLDGRSIELVPFVLAERERLVLKPTHGYGGRQVVIGSETPEPAWRRAVEASLGGPFVVQQRQAIPEQTFPVFDGGGLGFASLKLNVSPFYVGQADVGAVARVSRDSVINVGAGGGSVPTFVLD